MLKDASSVTADSDGHVWINASGCSAMAKGGSGDVLAGVIGSLLAQGMERTEAAALGVYLHGLMGEHVAERQGDKAVLARDLANAFFISQEIASYETKTLREDAHFVQRKMAAVAATLRRECASRHTFLCTGPHRGICRLSGVWAAGQAGEKPSLSDCTGVLQGRLSAGLTSTRRTDREKLPYVFVLDLTKM